jgi:MFS family permease
VLVSGAFSRPTAGGSPQLTALRRPTMAGTDHTQHDHTHSDTVRTDTVRTDGATVTRGAGRDAVAAQHDRFGGIKWGAAFFGWLSANGLAVILVALLSAAGVALGLAQNVDTADEAVDQANEIGIGGGIAILVVLFLAYLAGGYVAGRMARFDGARQGLAVWIVGLLVVLVLAAAGAILGSKYNVFQDLNLPRIPVDEGTATTAGIITLVAILLVTLLGAVLGGKIGDRYHRRVDRAGFDA